MPHLLCLTTLFLIALSLSSIALGQTSLWKVSKGEHHVYIGGTIHVMSEADYPLPKAFDRAYAKAQTVVFETDIALLNSPQIQQKMLSAYTLENGQSLKTTLSSEAYKQLESYCTEVGLPMMAIEHFKPIFVSIMLFGLEMQRLNMAGTGVDLHFYQRAQADHKKIGKLETVDQQINFLSNISGQDSELILHSLRDIKKITSLMQELKQSWRSGNNKKLEEVFIREIQQDFPDLYQKLFVNRNNAWIPQIKTMLKSVEIEIILVGAAHLVGQDGIISSLERQGYKVEQL